ncbi:hypothetical protein VKT23_010321 [Stygiomarasmius scandens]|uniref:Uncharacterized protein n=1 Tax=Marasmiellus scandens TaxID=2682957 RepID=A0ABR1JE14_9AGAR
MTALSPFFPFSNSMLILQAWPWLLVLPALFSVKAAIRNQTIDDTYGDGMGNFVEYLPEGAWHVGPKCTQCNAKPDPNQLFSESWHDGDYSPVPGRNNAPNQVLTATVNFNGSAIYVFGVLARSSSSPRVNGNSDMTFYIDNVVVGTLVKSGDSPNPFEYQVPIYVNESLSSGPHNFTLANGHVNGTESLVLLDKIVYSFDDGVPTVSNSVAPTPPGTTKTSNSGSSSHIPVAAICALLIFISLVLGIGIFWFCRQRAIRMKSERTGRNLDTFARPFFGNLQRASSMGKRKRTDPIGIQNSGKKTKRLLAAPIDMGVSGQSRERITGIDPPPYYSTP